MNANAAPPSVALLRLMAGTWVSHAISLAAKLGIADLLAEAPRNSDELARASEMHAPSLQRVLRALTGIGIFSLGEDGRFLAEIRRLSSWTLQDVFEAICLL